MPYLVSHPLCLLGTLTALQLHPTLATLHCVHALHMLCTHLSRVPPKVTLPLDSYDLRLGISWASGPCQCSPGPGSWALALPRVFLAGSLHCLSSEKCAPMILFAEEETKARGLKRSPQGHVFSPLGLGFPKGPSLKYQESPQVKPSTCGGDSGLSTPLQSQEALPGLWRCTKWSQLCLLVLGDAIWAPSILPHSTLSTLSHHPQLHFGRRMESKVSEGGLNVTLTIRLLMHGKVETQGRAEATSTVRSLAWTNSPCSKQSQTYKATASTSK